MAVKIHNLIAAINPDVYCAPEKQKKVKEILKELIEKKDPTAYLKVAEEAKPKDIEFMDSDILPLENPFKTPAFSMPVEQHTLSYDVAAQSLEPIYYWILDKLPEDYKVQEKLVDNFISSPGSGHFSEMGGKVTRMQEEAMKLLASANTVIRSILNIIYDLKEFQLLLDNYEDYNLPDKGKKEPAFLALKQRWLDNVDIKRGTTSIKAMSQNFDFVTIIDAFMTAKDEKHLESLDLNERVKRLLQQRFKEFLDWIKRSEAELRKRFEIEKIYLKSQVNALKLYAHWAKPYLRTARQLEQKANPTAALVNMFNTTLLELVVMGIRDYKKVEDVGAGDLPSVIMDEKTREYKEIILIELKFRSVPDRATQAGGYSFRGRVDLTFSSYALNEDEIFLLKDQIERDDLQDIFGAIEGSTGESLAQIQVDIDNLLSEKPKEKSEKKEGEQEDTNPFSALFSLFKKEKQKEEEKKKDVFTKVVEDSFFEKAMRSQALIDARRRCKKFYGSFKKANNMLDFE